MNIKVRSCAPILPSPMKPYVAKFVDVEAKDLLWLELVEVERVVGNLARLEKWEETEEIEDRMVVTMTVAMMLNFWDTKMIYGQLSRLQNSNGLVRDGRSKICMVSWFWFEFRSLDPSSFLRGWGLGWGWQGAASRRDRGDMDLWVLASLAHVTETIISHSLAPTHPYLFLRDLTLRLFPGYQR